MVTRREQLDQYLKLGLRPIPLWGKAARHRWKEFKLTESGIRYYLKLGTNWGICAGLLPSGDHLYFIDLDDKTMLSSFWESNPGVRKMPIVSTGKGFHVYGSWSKEVKTRHLGGIDIIGKGYVVSPPSVHQNGKPYRFVVPLGDSIPRLDPEVLVLPPTFPSLVHPSRGVKAEYRLDWQDVYNGVPKGRRHSVLVAFLGSLFTQRHPEDTAICLTSIWNKKCAPPLSEEELLETVRSCYKSWQGGKMI